MSWKSILFYNKKTDRDDFSFFPVYSSFFLFLLLFHNEKSHPLFRYFISGVVVSGGYIYCAFEVSDPF